MARIFLGAAMAEVLVLPIALLLGSPALRKRAKRLAKLFARAA